MAIACVIGLGRIGLPLSLVLAKADYLVYGVDSDLSTLSDVYNNNGRRTRTHAEKALLTRFLNKRLFVMKDLQSALSRAHVVFIAIGTGLSVKGEPELSNLFDLVQEICRDSGGVKGKLFVLKSTVPVGTTKKIASFIEKKTGFRCGEDFFVAFCPERALGDKALTEMEHLPKIIGGVNDKSAEKAAEVYRRIGGKLIIVDSSESAELIKLMDNAYRQTLFAFANDFALLAEHYGINAYELVKAANEGYPRNNIPLPSAGVSGYCLTKDPLYLEAAFKQVASRRGFPSVWYLARKANDYMPEHVVDLLRQALERFGRNIKGANILVCGISYKENTDDIRSSHGLEIARKLRDEGALVCLWDPQVRERNLGFRMVSDPHEALTDLDALVFTVRHDEFVQLSCTGAILRIVGKMRTPIVLDGWGIFQQLLKRKDVYYTGVGVSRQAKTRGLQ